MDLVVRNENIDWEKLEVMISDDEGADEKSVPAAYEEAMLADDDEDGDFQPIRQEFASLKVSERNTGQPRDSGENTQGRFPATPSGTPIPLTSQGMASGTSTSSEDGDYFGLDQPQSNAMENETEQVGVLPGAIRDLVDYGDVDESGKGDKPTKRPLKPRHNFKPRFFDPDGTCGKGKSWSMNFTTKRTSEETTREKEYFPRKDAPAIKPSRRVMGNGGNKVFRTAQEGQNHNDKLKMGLQSMVQLAGPSGATTSVVSTVQQEEHSDRETISGENHGDTEGQVRDSSDVCTMEDPYEYVMSLSYKGYNIYWELKTLKEEETCSRDLLPRMHKFVVNYQDKITGVCEAPNIFLAKRGASAHFLKNFKEHFPTSGNLPTEVPEGALIDQSVLSKLIEEWKEKFPGEKTLHNYHFPGFTRDSTSHIFKCILTIGGRNFEASSKLNSRVAKKMAAKMAYEELIQKPCPMVKIFQGEECTTPESFYRGVQSEMMHYYDFSRMTLLEPGAVRQFHQNRSNHSQRKRVLVSYEQPQNE